MNEDRIGTRLAELAGEYNRPPAAPREEIWAAIRPALAARRPPARRGRWATGIGMAATFLLGIAIGGTVTRGQETQVSGAAAVAAVDAAVDAETGRHLAQVDLLLRGVRADAAAGAFAAGRAESARLLLAENRFLTDLPPVEHPAEVAALLADIELVLAQIAVMEAGDGAEELRLVDEGIEAREVLPRLYQFALNL